MIIPTAADVVRTMAATFDEVIVPAMESPQQKSTAQTFRHLMRFVERRIEMEGQILLDEENKLKALLPGVAGHVRSLSAEGAALADRIESTLNREADPDTYPSLAILAARVGEVRQHVSDVLETLNSIEESDADKALHNELRQYIAWQIEQEGKLIQDAFWGRGPRR